MGIPFLYGKWLAQKYSHVLLSVIPPNVSSLAIDFNALIYFAVEVAYGTGAYHDVARQQLAAQVGPAVMETQIFYILSVIIDQLVYKIKPQNVLIIAADGCVPEGKLQQRRRRRYKSSLLRPPDALFDTSVITPGTEFMIRLDGYIKRLIAANHFKYGVKKIIYSSHLVPGEGEHKIYNYYRSGAVPRSDDYNVIYGMDADLIILSLLSDMDNIVLVREGVSFRFRDSNGNKIVRTSVKRPDTRNIYINNLKDVINNEMNWPQAVYDFSLIIMLVGNDFLPHPAAMSDVSISIEQLLTIYRTLDAPITIVKNTVEIQWGILATFLQRVAEIEPHIINELGKIQYTYPSRMVEAASTPQGVDYDKFRAAWYRNALDAKDPQLAQALDYTPPGASEDDVDAMALQFLTGMKWVTQYYTLGQDAVTWLWYYPYHYAPMVKDMADFLTINSNVIGDYVANIPSPEERRSNVLDQLVAVISPLSLYIIPQELQPLYSITSPIIDMMPYTFPIEKDGINHDFLGVEILPYADHDRVMRAVAGIPLPLQISKVYQQGIDDVRELSEETRRRLTAVAEVEEDARSVQRLRELRRLSRLGNLTYEERGEFNRLRERRRRILGEPSSPVPLPSPPPSIKEEPGKVTTFATRMGMVLPPGILDRSVEQYTIREEQLPAPLPTTEQPGTSFAQRYKLS